MIVGRENFTKTLLRANGRGQEIVADPGGIRMAPVLVEHTPRSMSDPQPWSAKDGRRFSGAECYARLTLPLPSGTVVEHTMSRRRGHFAGPGRELPELAALVYFTDSSTPLEISRNLLRVVGV